MRTTLLSFIVLVGAGSAPVLSQSLSPPAYIERITRSDVGPEFVAFSELVSLIASSDSSPELARLVATNQYGLTPTEADELIATSRTAYEEANAGAPDARGICSEDIGTSEEYVSWWADVARVNRELRLQMLRNVSSRVPARVWSEVMRQAERKWAANDFVATQTNHEKLVEAEDFRLLLQGICG